MMPKRLSDESGQIAIIFVMMIGMFLLFAVIVVDAGLWFSDRRDAQADVDNIALAGAIEIVTLDANQPPQERLDAIAAAEAWAVANGVDPATELTLTLATTAECYPEDDDPAHIGLIVGVDAVVSRVPPSFFISLFDLDPVVSTHALACAGVPIQFFGSRSLPRFPGQFRCRDYAASVSVVSLRS